MKKKNELGLTGLKYEQETLLPVAEVEAAEALRAVAEEIVLPEAKEKSGVIGRAAALGLCLSGSIPPEKVEVVRAQVAKDLKSKAEAKQVVITIDDAGNIKNFLSVYEKKVIIALQVRLSDLQKDGAYIIEAARKASSKELAKKEAAGIPDFLGYPIQALPDPVQKYLIEVAGFSEEQPLILFERRDFLKKYLGLEEGNINGAAYERLSKAIIKLLSSLCAITYKNSAGKRAFYSIRPISNYTTYTIGGKKYYILSLNKFFGKVVGDYMRTPRNNAEILNAIGDNEALFRIYAYILKQLSQNTAGVKIAARGDIREIHEAEEVLLTDFFSPNEIRKGKAAARKRMYTAFNTFYELGLISYPVAEAPKGGEVVITLNREAFSKE